MRINLLLILSATIYGGFGLKITPVSNRKFSKLTSKRKIMDFFKTFLMFLFSYTVYVQSLETIKNPAPKN